MAKHPIRRVRNLIFDQRLYIVILILIQLFLLVGILIRGARLTWLGDLLTVFSVVTALHLMLRPDKSAFKLSLVFLILLFPVIGGVFYWVFHARLPSPKRDRKWEKVGQAAKSATPHDPAVAAAAIAAVPEARKPISYLTQNTPYPVYENTDVRYFSGGAAMLPALLEDLSRAERYIFMEYFIIEEGEMWSSILDVLTAKASAGVDVRVMYDDIGSIMTLPAGYDKKLRARGIQCVRFNRFHTLLTTTQNNRDHRKICSVDGKLAYTGGVNLADEYIDKKIKHGKWKDSAIRLCGDAAWSLTVLFLQSWSVMTLAEEELSAFRPQGFKAPASSGWVQPYAGDPFDKESIAERVFHSVIDSAKSYLYITTPYLMVDDGMLSALKLCAKSGVDVRIITPEVPDKKAVHFTTRSYYRTLLEAGVRIYEFSGGFMHAKNFVSDDAVAIVGTANLDFRSLYLHFECGACLYRSPAVADVKADFLATLPACREITPADTKTNLLASCLRSICRIFAPLM